jgi:hypothetical protein
VECDGGRGAREAMIAPDRISVTACDHFGQELTGGKDDRVFRLDRGQRLRVRR